MTPAAGQTWTPKRENSRPYRVEYIILASANHTDRVEQIVVYHAAYGQHADPSRAWATPFDDFLASFTHVPDPRHPAAQPESC